MSINNLALSTVVGVGEGAQQPPSPLYANVLTFTGDTAYPTGGTPAFQAQVRSLFGDNRLVAAVVPQDCGGYQVAYDPVNDKLKVWVPGANTEVPNATNLGAVNFTVLVLAY